MNTMTSTQSILSAANEASRWLTLSEAAKSLPTVYGKKIHTATLWRWCRKGVRGVRLEYRRLGRTILVSADSLAAFFVALAQQDDACHNGSDLSLPRRRASCRRAQQRRRQEHQQAIQTLIDAGILKPDKAGVSQ